MSVHFCAYSQCINMRGEQPVAGAIRAYATTAKDGGPTRSRLIRVSSWIDYRQLVTMYPYYSVRFLCVSKRSRK
jgi:hypothetical protein